MKTLALRAGVLALSLGMLASACSSGGSSGGQMTIGSDKANDHGTADVTGKSSTAVSLNNYFFQSTVLKGSPGQKVTLQLKNDGTALHNFSLPEQSVDQDVQKGATETVSVTFPQSGFLEFFCKYHRSLGMAGELTTG